ncbi:FRIGIDA-like protein 2 [Apium graveolens]|uniref:FRIGIDA-like protein 2 n=1 Tax=Apium graveolens TaxID=4045 RepID=UPI003D79B4BF
MGTTMKAISAAMKLIDVKKQNLKKAFEDLQSHSSSLSSFTLTWSHIDSHFTSLHSSLQHQFQFLQTLESQSPSIPPNSTPARPQLKSLCQNMDAIGLRSYIISNPRDRDSIRLELADAFASCRDPGALVLDTMSGFSSTNDVELRRSCVMFLEELMVLKTEIKGEAREKAMILAIDCKEMLSGVTSINNNIFGLLGFLLLVAVYGLRHAFSVDELMDYVVVVAKNKIAVQLCRLLDFGDNIAGIIEKLISKGNQLIAVKFIFEFEMTKQFPPVPLLEEYAKESKSLVQKIRMSGDVNSQKMRDATLNELDKLKSVVKCVEDYKLASEFPKLNVLMQRIRNLEREKSNRKRAGAASASVFGKQPKLQKKNIMNHSQTSEQADPVTVTKRDNMSEKQLKLQKETVINHLQPADPASVTTRDTASVTTKNTANLTIPENVVTSAIPSYQQTATYAAAPIGPYGMATSNPDTHPYAAAHIEPYVMASSNPETHLYAAAHIEPYAMTSTYNGNPAFYPSGSQIPGETFEMSLYEQSGPPMGFNGNIPATSSGLYPPVSQMPSGYNVGNTAYGGYGWAPEYHPSYYPQ